MLKVIYSMIEFLDMIKPMHIAIFLNSYIVSITAGIQPRIQYVRGSFEQNHFKDFLSFAYCYAGRYLLFKKKNQRKGFRHLHNYYHSLFKKLKKLQ